MFVISFIHLNEQEVGMLFGEVEDLPSGIEKCVSVDVVQGGFLIF
jgi:hypothetical protein